MTYAAGTGASAVVWIATQFRDEHGATLDRLNEGTKEPGLPNAVERA